MTNREVVGGEVDAATVDEAVEVGFVGVIDDLLIAVVLHHDEKHMVEMRNSAGVVLLREAGNCKRTGEKSQGCCVPEHGF